MPFTWIARFTLLAGLGLALAGCAGGVGTVSSDFDPDLPKPHDYPVYGIDVSKYQGNVDWNAVASSGVKFAWIKASEGGDHVGPDVPGELGRGQGGGRGRAAPTTSCIGAAIRSNRSNGSSRTCAGRGGRAAARARSRGRLPSPRPAVAIWKRPRPSRTCAIAVEEMERYFGKRPVIYTSVDFYEAILSDGEFSDYPMWVRSTKHHPSVRYGSRKWVFWQYQADGRVPGIDGKVDRNAFHGTEDEWRAFLAKL